MSKQRGTLWGVLFGAPPTERHSLAELQRLHALLMQNLVVTDYNKASVIETLRALAEILIWGDQHEPRVFEYFLEHNLLQHFKSILANPAHRKGEVAVQLLQTLSILITNIRKDTSLYYIFSNNHINNIVGLTFDFRDEEVLAHYITFLKAISFKLNTSTIQFFFQQDASGRATFPLYTEAVKLFNHSEGMVRAAVRMLTINIYGVADAGMQGYIVSSPSVNYFHELALLLADRARALDVQLLALQQGHASALESVNSRMAEIEDALAYVSDILHVAPPPLETEVTAAIWESFISPVALQPLLALQEGSSAAEPSSLSTRVRLVTALHVLERCFLQLAASPVVDAIACALLAGGQDAPPRCALRVQTFVAASPAAIRADLDGGVRSHPTLDSTETCSPASARGSAAASAQPSPSTMSGADNTIPAHINKRAMLNGSAFRDAPRHDGLPSERDGGAGGSSSNWGDATPTATPHRSPAVTPTLNLTLLHSTSSQRLAPISPYSAPGRSASMRAQLTQCRAAFLSCFKSRGGEHMGAAARTLVSMLHAQLSEDVTAAVGLSAAISPDLRGAQARDLRGDFGTPQRMRSSQGDTNGDANGAAINNGGAPPPDPRAPSPRPPVTPTSTGVSPGPSRYDLHTRHSLTSTMSLTSSIFNENLVDDLVRNVVSTSLESGSARSIAHLTEELIDHVASAAVTPGLAPPAIAACGWLLAQLLPAAATVGSAVPPHVATALAAALRDARADFGEQLHLPWCDALSTITYCEWPRLRSVTQLGKFYSSGAELMEWISTPPLSRSTGLPSQRGSSPPTAPPRESSFALATVAVAVVQRCCALLQVDALLTSGTVAAEPPIPPIDLEQHELRDGNMVSTSSAPELPCKVSFRRGEEKTVYLALLGSRGGQASPQAVLAAPAPQCLSAGRVLSSAPLMSLAPAPHEKQSQWLQCRVRPSVKMLKSIMESSRLQGMPLALSTSTKQLDDGLWVLAFPDAARATEAIEAVGKVVMKSQAEFFDVLTPMHSTT